ncbi:MAG: hypothetical protein AUH86_22660 [Acidobacteria bacterium 13_1_40CM_4_58_4]|nr:MAG: hypothetical protein AUH86_22660 [Acidobacteria bacterium 13_1_40CM_4_58_4]
MLGNLSTHRYARNAQLITFSVVALHEHAHSVAAILRIEHAGRGADPALEFVADHACAATDIAFFDWPSMGGVQRLNGVLRLDVKTIHIVQVAIPGLRHHGQGPPEAFLIRLLPLYLPGYDRIAHHTHAMRIGDHHRPVQEA